VKEQWVDEGAIRSEAEAAAGRASADTGRGRRISSDLSPEVETDLANAAPSSRTERYRERLTTAADALDRGRYGDARRMVQPVLRDLPDLAFGHEIAGLALYRLGQWRKAIAELELARTLSGTVQHHAVLADCYRALRRYTEVEALWKELKEASPEPALMAEGRIVAAGALADQGDLAGALKVMQRATDTPKKPKEYHLRQWYVLGDLYDRSGDVVAARRFFGLVASVDAEFADVLERLRSLGR
jgi:tetratricopeptide (TPR) repeat protein